MTVKLVGSTSGSVSLQAPASTSGGAHRVLTLPDVNGTVATTSTAGKFASYALICDSKGNNTDGGTFTTGAWRTRDLNQEISDEDGIVSISSNQFTLGAGSYLIKFRAPAVKVDFHVTRLVLLTGGVSSFSEKAGSSEYTGGSVLQTVSFGVARVTLTGSGAFVVQHQASATKTVDGFGQPSNGYANESIYTTVEIYKEL